MKYIINALFITFLSIFTSCVHDEYKADGPIRNQRENDFVKALAYHQAIEDIVDRLVEDKQLEQKISTERQSQTGDNYWTPLCFAASAGDRAAVEYIVGKGANVSFKDGNGDTPLLLAATAGNIENIDVLLTHGADINARDINDFTAVIDAAAAGNTQTVKYLVDKGCDLGQITGDLNALDFAIFYDRKEIVAFLQSKGMKKTDTLGRLLNNQL